MPHDDAATDGTRERVTRELLDAAAFMARAGQLRATSGNLSARLGTGRVLMTASGTDKARLTAADLMLVDDSGRPADGETRTPSNEAALHMVVYRLFPSVGCVLHGHGRAATVLSQLHATEKQVTLRGLEMVKALEGHADPESPLTLPIFHNDQDVSALALLVEKSLPPGAPGFLLQGHGLYAWGRDVASAVRHLDALDFLLDAHLTLQMVKP